MPIPRPCLTCGEPTPNGTRCPNCDSERQQQRNARRDHYKGQYKRMAAHIRATATNCHICGQSAIEGDPWTADHLIPGNPDSPLAPAHRSCNSRKGNRT